MRHTLVATILMVLGIANAGGASDQFTVVLHARLGWGSGSCTAAGLPDCVQIRPTTQVFQYGYYRIYIYVNNYNDIQALQTAFAWPADWQIDEEKGISIRGCRAGMLTVNQPYNPGGAYSGTFATAFDCVQGPNLVPIARMDFDTRGSDGCLTQVNPVQGTGRVEIVDCQNRSYLIDASDPVQRPRLGSICKGMPGQDACDPLTTPVEEATWGRIKATYR